MSNRHIPILKVLLLGDMCVGKTSLMRRYVNKTFTSVYKNTVGADLGTKRLVINESLVNLQIWDTAGQEICGKLGTIFYRGADCCFLVFDVTSRKSFQNLSKWWEDFFSMAGIKNRDKFPLGVVGNKIDLENEREVSKREAQQWCKSFSVPYFECSAKDGSDVELAFESLAEKAVAIQDEKWVEPVTYFNESFVIVDAPPEKRRKKCDCN
ncbi:ras-related protein Rab-7a-like [Drosophila albomicans]|uniref:Ras-related protein Rab-7b n=1 Tax=Drosophila albomicans TaxID=7291 RepID=A0A9C6T6J3_DROAB|nr:ras-related protein Rab-7a-like [Drosophila albomicans]